MAAAAPRNSPNSPTQRISPLLDTIITGSCEFITDDKGKTYIGREISLKTLKLIPQIEKCWIGRIGIIPYYNTADNIHLLLVKSNWEDKKTQTIGTVTGFIGGGVGKRKTAMEGLQDELKEEIPEYYNAIMTQLHDDNGDNMTIILTAELAADVNSLACKLVSAYSIIIFLNVTDVAVLKQMPHTFDANTNMSKSHKYREIEQILDIPVKPVKGSEHSFLKVLKSRIGEINNGLEYYKKYLKYSGIDIYQGQPFMKCIPHQIVRPSPRNQYVHQPVRRQSILPRSYKTYTSKKSPKNSPKKTRKSPTKPKSHN